ncbi:hypothetical protein ACFL2D_01450 [Patescibacteria group bacterium]
MTKISLIILGAVIALMGIGGLIPSFELGDEPVWHAVAKIVIGLVAILIAIMDKKKTG